MRHRNMKIKLKYVISFPHNSTTINSIIMEFSWLLPLCQILPIKISKTTLYDELAFWRTCNIELLKGVTLILASPILYIYIYFTWYVLPYPNFMHGINYD